jgi:proteic killer suppression protein
MDVTISDRKLEKAANDERKLTKVYGKTRAKLIKRRLDDLLDIDNLEAARHLPGKYHELIANRKGQWACHLDGNYRLIFRPHEDPIPTDPDGRYIWIEILGVEVIEIVDYHRK